MKCFVLEVATNNGWYYAVDDSGCCPNILKAKMFDNILKVQEFRKQYWRDAEYKARCVEIEINVIWTEGE